MELIFWICSLRLNVLGDPPGPLLNEVHLLDPFLKCPISFFRHVDDLSPLSGDLLGGLSHLVGRLGHLVDGGGDFVDGGCLGSDGALLFFGGDGYLGGGGAGALDQFGNARHYLVEVFHHLIELIGQLPDLVPLLHGKTQGKVPVGNLGGQPCHIGQGFQAFLNEEDD